MPTLTATQTSGPQPISPGASLTVRANVPGTVSVTYTPAPLTPASVWSAWTGGTLSNGQSFTDYPNTAIFVQVACSLGSCTYDIGTGDQRFTVPPFDWRSQLSSTLAQVSSLTSKLSGMVIPAGSTAGVGWYDPAWTARTKFTIDPTKVGANQTSYPFYVQLTDYTFTQNMRTGGKDIVFTAKDGVTKLPHELLQIRQSGAIGCWSWFSDPRIIYVPSIPGYVFGYVSAAGTPTVGLRYETDGTFAATFPLSVALEIDDHDNPVFVRRSDGRFVAFYSKHGTDTTTRYRISNNPDDISAWATEVQVTRSGNVTYSNPYILSDNKCYLFSRIDISGNTRRPSFIVTSDYVNWTADQNVFNVLNQRPYVRYAQRGDRIDLLLTNAQPDEANTSVYHCYARLINGSLVWFKSDGTQITTALPFGIADVTLIYDGSANSAVAPKAWIWDITYNTQGLPVVLFSKIPNATTHSYWFCSFNGRTWNAPVQIGPGGNPALYPNQAGYTAGIGFDGNSSWVVAAGIWNGAGYDLTQFQSPDQQGVTWDNGTPIVANTGTSMTNARPWSPRSHGTYTQWYWWGGFYTDFSTSYITYPCFEPGTAVGAYVGLPFISASTATAVYAYTGNPNVTNQSATSGVFDSNYLSVYHGMPIPASVSSLDSQGLSNATKRAINLPGFVQGFGPTRAGWSGFGNSLMSVGNAINMASNSTFSIEVVAAGDLNSTLPYTLYTNWDFAATQKAGVIIRLSSSGVYTALCLTGANSTVGGAMNFSATASTITHYGANFNTTTWSGLANGVVTSSYPTSTNFASTASNPGYIGVGNSTNVFIGQGIYEVRLSQIERSSSWMQTVANNLVSTATFYTQGQVERLLAP